LGGRGMVWVESFLGILNEKIGSQSIENDL